jgi:hypothetical protein
MLAKCALAPMIFPSAFTPDLMPSWMAVLSSTGIRPLDAAGANLGFPSSPFRARRPLGKSNQGLELILGQLGLPQDVGQGAGRHGLATVDGPGDTPATLGPSQLAVSAFARHFHEPGAPEHNAHLARGGDGQPAHAGASTVTIGASLGAGRGGAGRLHSTPGRAS